jgi:hypothetical protein
MSFLIILYWSTKYYLKFNIILVTSLYKKKKEIYKL